MIQTGKMHVWFLKNANVFTYIIKAGVSTLKLVLQLKLLDSQGYLWLSYDLANLKYITSFQIPIIVIPIYFHSEFQTIVNSNTFHSWFTNLTSDVQMTERKKSGISSFPDKKLVSAANSKKVSKITQKRKGVKSTLPTFI